MASPVQINSYCDYVSLVAAIDDVSDPAAQQNANDSFSIDLQHQQNAANDAQRHQSQAAAQQNAAVYSYRYATLTKDLGLEEPLPTIYSSRNINIPRVRYTTSYLTGRNAVTFLGNEQHQCQFCGVFEGEVHLETCSHAMMLNEQALIASMKDKYVEYDSWAVERIE